jgi:hypothetical protein
MNVVRCEASNRLELSFDAAALECGRGAFTGLPQKAHVTAPTANIPAVITNKSPFIASSPFVLLPE